MTFSKQLFLLFKWAIAGFGEELYFQKINKIAFEN